MLVVTGQVERVQERTAGNPERGTWVEQTLVIRDWGQTLYVTASQDFVSAGLPSSGDWVAIDVAVDAYVNTKTGKAGHSFKGFRRNLEVEGKLYGEGSQATQLRAASGS